MPDLFRPIKKSAWRNYETIADRALHQIQDRELRVAIGTLFADTQKLVDDGSVDIVVLAARRLVCLYELLVRHGMKPLDGCLVVSDRYLESKPDLYSASSQSCHVLILDDSVVLGTTLFKLTERIASLIGAKGSVRSRTVCIDEGQVAAFLFEAMDFQPIYGRDTAAVQEYSKQIVLALFEQQIPFFADFPVSTPIECPRHAWESLLESERWYVADVTAPSLDGTGSYALALIPRPATLDLLLSRTMPAVAALLDAMKVRLYARDDIDKVRAVIVPIAMIAPATPEALDLALEEVAGVLREREEAIQLNWRTWAPEAKHRLVQLYASACVLAELWPEVAAISEVESLRSRLLEQLPVGLYFGAASEQTLAAFNAVVRAYEATPPGHYPRPPRVRIEEPVPAPLLFDDDVQRMLWGTQSIVEGTGVPEAPGLTELTKTGLIFSHAISAIFGFLNKNYEVPQRDEIRALRSVSAYREWLGDGSKRILSQGLTLRELVVNLLPAGTDETVWNRSLVSLGIDQGNDLGIMVPVTMYDHIRNLVYRCYRIGETAPLASSPLIEVAKSERFPIDEFISAMLAGFPIEPVKMSISEFLTERPMRVTPISRADLMRRVKSTVPGHPVERYEGMVVALDGQKVEATLINPTEDDPRDARIPLDRIHPDWRSTLRSGSRFTWTTYEDESAKTMRRTIEIKMRSLPAIDMEQLNRNAAAVSANDPDPHDASSG